MKSIGLTGAINSIRRAVSGSDKLFQSDVDTPTKLVEVLRKTLTRISSLEAASQPNVTEFEVNVGNGGATTTLSHMYGGPVRYWVTHWTKQVGGAYPTAAPILVVDSSSTNDELVLKSYTTGKAVIRVEASQAQVVY